MSMKFAFAGFRHGHIHALLNLVKSTPDMEIVGAFEDDLPTCEALEKNKAAVVTHHDFDAMLAETECDEEGKHGGTINDIAVHALDLIPWITGHKFKRIVAARCWNALAKRCPHFKDAAQLMLEMDNGAGVMGDVS